MTNELRDELARVINDVNGATTWEEVKNIAKNDGYMVAKGIVSMRMDEAQAVIDHLTPMMKEVVVALEDYQALCSENADVNEYGCGETWQTQSNDIAALISSLPACWRENGGEV